MSTSYIIAKHLLEIKAVQLRPEKPFQWASGWLSPIYCDNRLTLSYPEIRRQIKEGLLELIEEYYPKVEGIAGVATAGIPQGTLLAEILNLPFVYIRSQSKDHGLENRVEGKVNPDQNFVVVEDLISTGKSSLSSANALKEQKAKIAGMVCVFTYELNEAKRNFDSAGIELHPLLTYSELLEVALEEDYISKKELELLRKWRENPAEWGRGG
ncbi:MAG: orotate phosphoribosyltransferase [Bacteroidetes bacterium RIFCSPLOWO2_02_FULL_36_8]|nr:MAG: orotate phosphoribosyltransferase [Bacteroidetes bacterium RIFCSPLOWO2_02_FULL_36_8]OFY71622.1 MAG: orotate phosphoribosyltransferase [Bacteroidetes bacterium RIFCSPLOWO2_12_FULL_37_12]